MASRKQLWVDIGAGAALIGAMGILVYVLGGVLLPFLVSGLLAYLLVPVVDLLERGGLSRRGAVGALYGGFTALIVVSLMYVVPLLTHQIKTLHSSLPEYSSRAQDKLVALQENLEQRFPELKQYNLAETLPNKASAYLNEFFLRLPQLVLNVFTLLSVFVFIPILTWYLLVDGPAIKRALISLAPNRYFEPVLHLVHRVDRHLSSYLFGQSLEAMVVGLLSAIGYSILGVPYAIVIGILSGLANLIPYVGPAVGAIAALIVTVLEVGFTTKIFLVLLVAAAVQVMDNLWIYPMVMSRSLSLHPLTILAILIIAGSTFGLWGLLLGIPVFSVCRIFLQELAGVIRRQSTDVIQAASFSPSRQ